MQTFFIQSNFASNFAAQAFQGLLLKGCSLFNFCTTMPGCRQRAAAAALIDNSRANGGVGAEGGSCLISLIVGMWSWGLMSPQLVQKIANAARKDLEKALESEASADIVMKEISEIASIGVYGKYPNHCGHALREKLQLVASSVKPFFCRMPLKVMGALDNVTWLMKQGMLLPHEFFAVCASVYPTAFEKLFCPSRDRLAAFWDNMKDNPQLKGQCLPNFI